MLLYINISRECLSQKFFSFSTFAPQRGEITNQSPGGRYAFIDGPLHIFDVGAWERHLDYLQKLPDDISNKAAEIESAEQSIALLKELAQGADPEEIAAREFAKLTTVLAKWIMGNGGHQG